MSRILVSIDVTKIDKEHLFKGKKGTYLDLVLIPVKENQYGDDFLVKQDIKRGAVDSIILGNAKYAASLQKQQPTKQVEEQPEGDQIPF